MLAGVLALLPLVCCSLADAADTAAVGVDIQVLFGPLVPVRAAFEIIFSPLPSLVLPCLAEWRPPRARLRGGEVSRGHTTLVPARLRNVLSLAQSLV